MWRGSLLSVFVLLLLGSLLLNSGTVATAYGASSYLFESGFENELTADFEGTVLRGTVAGAKLERVTNVFHHGMHSLHVVVPPRVDSLQYAWTNFDHVSEIYVRFYVYFPDDSLFIYPNAWAPGDLDYWLYFLAGPAYLEPNGTEPKSAQGYQLFTWGSLRLMHYPESTERPEGYYFSGTRWSEGEGNRMYHPFDIPTPDAFPIQGDRWYCLEVHHKMASGPGQSDGLAELWVDGTFEDGQYTSSPYLQAPNIANYEPTAPYYGAIEIGNREAPPSATPDETPNLEIYIDCLKIGTEPIGLEPDEYSPPTIGSPTREPTTVMPDQNVTVLVNVTDESGVREVILSYSTDEGATMTNKTMNPAAGDAYEGNISGFPFGTNVSYMIFAYDNVGNVAIKDNEGQYYVYEVVPEFSTWPVFLGTLLLITIFVIFIKKKLPSSRA